MKIVLFIVYLVNYIVYALHLYRREYISMTLLFATSQLAMFAGIVQLTDMTIQADRVLILIYIVTQLIFYISGLFFEKLFPVTVNKAIIAKESVLLGFQKQRITVIIVVAIIACLYLFSQMGSSLFVVAIRSLVSGTASNLTEARLSAYKIHGLGYIYQFRVILLPILTAYLICFGSTKGKKIGVAIFPFMLISLLATGQRGGFAMFCLIWLTAMCIYNKIYQAHYEKVIIVVAGLFVGVMAVMTIANGRQSATGGNVLAALLSRFTTDNQKSAVVGFRYIYSEPCQWGKDWFVSLADLLPGKSDYVSLASQIFQVMYGSLRGTAPACIWGSAYYNWDLFGIICMPILIAGICKYVVYRCYRLTMTPLRIMIYSGVFVLFGFWIADSPMFLFNQGWITLIILGYILHIDKFAKRRGEIK